MKKFKQTLLNNPSTAHTVFFCSLLVFVGMMGSLTIDMYVPSLPVIAKTFSATATSVKLTITVYLVSYGIGQLFYGPLIDCFGRKRILMLAVIAGTLGSIFCALSSSVFELCMGRMLQGAGYAAIGVATPAMARDILDDRQFAQAASIFSLAFGLGPIFSPIIGSYIDYFFGWRTVFTVISAYSVLVFFIILIVIPETIDQNKKHVFHVTSILKSYWNIVKNGVFVKNTACKSIAYTGFIVFYAVTPFMLQNHLGLTLIQYGWITLTLTGTILLAKLTNTIILNHIDIDRLIFYSAVVLAVGSGLLFIFGLLNYYSVISIVLPFMIFGFGSGFLFSNATVASFKPFKGISTGMVSGLMNGLQLIFAFFATTIAAHLPLSTLLPLGIFMFVIGIGAVLVYSHNT